MLPNQSNQSDSHKPFSLLFVLVWFYLGVIAVASLVAGADGAKFSIGGSIACLWLVVFTNYLLPIPNQMYRMLVGTMLRTVLGLVMVGVAIRVLGFEQKMAVLTALPLYLGMIGVEIMEALRHQAANDPTRLNPTDKTSTGITSTGSYPQA